MSDDITLNDGKPTTDRLYAWLRTNEDGLEGVVTIQTDNGPVPLISTDLAGIRTMKAHARLVGLLSRQRVYLVAFNRAETIDIIE